MPDERINPHVPPSGSGCVECLASDGWWFHLRRCAACGHIGCCDTSPGQHATNHAKSTGHTVLRSFEPGEDWFWDFVTEEGFEGRGSRHRRTTHSINRRRVPPARCPATGSGTSIEVAV